MKHLETHITDQAFAALCADVPTHGQAVFQTMGGGNSWRQLLAFNPTSTFILDTIDQLDQLRSFLHSNRDNLCAGFLSYDLGLELHKVSSKHERKQPLAVFHAYDNWVELKAGRIHVSNAEESISEMLQRATQKESFTKPEKIELRFKTSIQQSEYEQSIQSIQDYIRAGDFYQINFTQQLEAEYLGSARTLFSNLVQGHPAEHACYMEFGDQAIHSLSPELFLHYSAGTLTTKPIKGTRPRGKHQAEDEILKQALLDSEKEQAELFMITDLLRNDLGQVCEIGSVKVISEKSLNKLPKVWHTYSHISGKLRPDLHPIDALLSMYPGGSITGCPKKRALEVIDELESSSRGIYTGSLGYFHPDGDFSFNIAIRTLVQQGQKISLGSGGGITIDSNWQAEWDELMVKVSTFE